VDGVGRHILFHRVGRLPLYVSGTVAEFAIRRAFLETVAVPLGFGLPATAALICLVLLVLRRTIEAEQAAARVEAERLARAEAEKALAQAAKLESVGQLAAGIAHDFNNVLAAVMGALELLRHRLRAGRGPAPGLRPCWRAHKAG